MIMKRLIDGAALIGKLRTRKANAVGHAEVQTAYETAMNDAIDAEELSLNTLRDEVYQDAVAHGLWEDTDKYADELGENASEKEQHRWIEAIKKVYLECDEALTQVPKWISVKDKKPKEFVSVQVYMTDAGDFPPVREGYYVDEDRFYIPALHEFHPVSHWKPFNEPPEE